MAKKLGVHIEIIPDMYELGFFKKTLSSRKRLRLTAFACFVGLLLFYLACGYVIRYVSLWEWLNIILILASIICSIVVAYIVALVVGDVIFHGPWREKMIKGAKFIPDDLEDQKALLKNKSFYFLLIWVFSIIVLCFGCDFCTGSNIRWYQNIGSTLNSMKSPDVSERRFIIKTISNAFYSKKWANEEIRENVRQLILDEDVEVQSWAAYLAGRAKLVEGSDELMQLAKNPDADIVSRREAIIALGRMDWKQARAGLYSIMKQTFASNHKDDEIIPAVLYAFFMLKDSMATQETIQMMRVCLDSRDCSTEILQYGFFYLKSMRATDAAELCVNYLDAPNISQEMRCYASDVLRFTATKAQVPRMKEEYSRATPGDECPVVYRRYHSEPAVILFERELLRAQFVKAVGNIMDAADYDWIWNIGNNQSESLQTRKVAEMYTRAMIDKGIVK